ncbi:BRCA1-associated RING domain protein 1 [Fistulifera solaris]|uniref:BRCA1-associated RING domain protein 1 n=1 Tax=Fistulifera solaris TaxID=1519565 RepID=A0A1Z5KLH0_FISSO|nr:BRCA1-associated RING domain protein 1 [Fistulifera solaris]|eukprot:GAX27129.1 BRCA1-associated RING domain protein 1 [Fistulifera solaris]
MEAVDEKLSTAEVCKRIQTALDNMGRALKCPVCLSTLRDNPVVLSSCVHAFCQSCLTRSFESSTKETCCPICKVPCHRRRSVSEAPFLGKLAHAYQRTLRHFGLTPVKYTTSLPLLTQLGPEENDSQQEDDVAMVHRHFQVSKTFELAMRQDKLASRNTILQQHQSVVEANGKVLLETIVKRRNVDVKKPTVHFRVNPTTLAHSETAIELRIEDKDELISTEEHVSTNNSADRSVNLSESARAISSAEEAKEDDGTNAFTRPCLKTPSSGGQKLTIRSSASKISVQFPSLSPIAPNQSPMLKRNVDETNEIVDESSSMLAEGISEQQIIKVSSQGACLESDNDVPTPIEESSPRIEAVDGESKTPLHKPKTATKTLNYKAKARLQTPETDKSSDSIFSDSKDLITTSFKVGDIISVKPRTWPGINKQGGIAKVAKVNDDNSYDVSYVLGGKEKRVDAVFCLIHDDSLPDRKKDTIPVCLLQQLASEGFDIQGDQGVEQPIIEPASDKPRTVADKKRERVVIKRKTVADKKERQKRPKLEKRSEASNSQAPSLDSLLGLSSLELTFLADSLYRCRLDASIKRKEIVVLSSGLPEYDSAQLKELEKRSKKWDVAVKVSSIFNAKRVTLCLTPAAVGSKGGSAIAHRRTMKGMQCAVAGIPIVSCEWIHQCLSASKIIPPLSSMYIRALPATGSSSRNNGVALLAAYQQQFQEAPAPLQKCHVFLSGISVEKQKDTIVILREAGAIVVTSTPALLKLLGNEQEKAPAKIVVVCDDVLPRNLATSLPSLQLAGHVLIVNSSWVFDSICAGQKLPSVDYPPSHHSARLFWERQSDWGVASNEQESKGHRMDHLETLSLETLT